VAQAWGRSRGGVSTPIPVGCLDDHIRAARELTSGARPEAPLVAPVVAQRPALPPRTAAVMDNGDDRAQHRQGREVWPVSPPQRTRQQLLADDPAPSQRREHVERFVTKRHQVCRMATRDEQWPQTCVAVIPLVASWLMIRSFVNRT
jgi:hypothetical protein